MSHIGSSYVKSHERVACESSCKMAWDGEGQDECIQVFLRPHLGDVSKTFLSNIKGKLRVKRENSFYLIEMGRIERIEKIAR